MNSRPHVRQVEQTETSDHKQVTKATISETNNEMITVDKSDQNESQKPSDYYNRVLDLRPC